MHLSTIDMTREDAEQALAEWGETIKRAKVSEEDAAITAGYAEIAKGRRLLSLSSTLREGGEDDLHRPRLAVAPATAEVTYLTRWRNGSVAFATSDAARPEEWARDVASAGVRVRGAFPEIDYRVAYDNRLESNRWRESWKAMVPVVPPRFRRSGYRSAHILFEAEWALHQPPAPVDPALIRHLRGDLWVVLGVWDLTPLERAVLTERNAR